MNDATPDHACAFGISHTLRSMSTLKSFSTVFTNEKAGMQHADMSLQEKIKQVVYDMSKDSAHHENELRKQGKVAERISIMKSIQSGLSVCSLKRREQELQPLLAQLEAQRDLSQVWLHVDMDAFYAACEERDNPKLKAIPIAIGGMSMISTANYEARKYGVRAAMPGFIAVKLCPQLKFIKSDFKKYEQAAAQAREVFALFDPKYSVRGLDEASLCITKYCKEKGESPTQVAKQIRMQVFAKTGLTCSCGTAPNTMLAKICSDMRKPNGQFHIDCTRDAVMEFIEVLSVRKVSEQLLHEFGVSVVSDLYHYRGLLSYLFSSVSMSFFMHVALGLGSTQHPESKDAHCEGRKSVSHEQTFTALEKTDDLQEKIDELANLVSQDLLEAGMCGKCVTLKLKQTDFRVRQRSTTLPTGINSAEVISSAAKKLLSHEIPIKARLVGIKVSTLQDATSTTRLEAFLQKAQINSSNKVADAHAVIQANVERQGLSEYSNQRVHPHTTKRPPTHKGLCALASLENGLECASIHQPMARSYTQDNGSLLLCSECGATVARCDMQEHMDMHIAVALSRQMNGPSYISPQAKGLDVTRDVPSCSGGSTSCAANRKVGKRSLTQSRLVLQKKGKVSKSPASKDHVSSFLGRRIGKG